jgi:hypothetical protein
MKEKEILKIGNNYLNNINEIIPEEEKTQLNAKKKNVNIEDFKNIFGESFIQK